MLNKILENLPFEPGIPQPLAQFRTEESRRRLMRGAGVVMVGLALLVQVFAFVGSPKAGASGSPNDLIPGGIGSKAELVNDCNSNFHYIQLIYAWYGVSCADIANPSSGVITLNSTNYGGSLYSMGHDQQGFAGEFPVSIWGATMWWRPLHAWDGGRASGTNYTALAVKADNGRQYFILFGCGNLVSVGVPQPYTPPAPTPVAPTPVAPTPVAPTPIAKPPVVPLCQYNSQLPATSPLCKPCKKSTSGTDTQSCLLYHKKAANLTQGLPDANNTTANPGDTIQYTLTVQNTGEADAKNVIITEDLSDVLVYADPGNLNGGTIAAAQNGGGTGQSLSWPAVTVPAKGSVSKTFTMVVKNPLPALAPLPQDPTLHDNTMTNIYGDTINIHVKQPTPVTAAAALPNTGPGAGVIVMAVVMVIAGYFYFRSRLLVKETEIVQNIQLQEARL